MASAQRPPGPALPDAQYAAMQATAQADREKEIANFCKTPRSRDEIQNHIKVKHREYFRKKILAPLIQKGVLKLTITEKPSSPNQKYFSGDKEDQDG